MYTHHHHQVAIGFSWKRFVSTVTRGSDQVIYPSRWWSSHTAFADPPSPFKNLFSLLQDGLLDIGILTQTWCLGNIKAFITITGHDYSNKTSKTVLFPKN